jgi:hypothetical protein
MEDDPKSALAAYIENLSKNYYKWYERSHARNRRLWSVGHGMVLLAGVLASVIAAATAADRTLTDLSIVRTALIVLPILSTLASSLMSQSRVRDLMALRERGREQLQHIIDRARVDYAAHSGDPDRLTAIHAALVEQVSAVERQQSNDFNSIVPGGAERGAVLQQASS